MTTPNFCDTGIYDNVLVAKKQALLFNVPKTRYDNLQNNPYDGTVDANARKYELDMRRKAEILKYNRNNGQPTKKQSWTQIANGRTPYKRYISQTQIQQGISDACLTSLSAQINAPTLSNNAGIPGPSFMVKLDDNVPLYNYTNTIQNVYGVENKSSGEEYTVVTNYDQYSTSNIFSLFIQPDITTVYKTFNLSIPVAVEISGYIDNTFSTKFISLNTFAISDFELEIFFGNQKQTLSPVTKTYSFDGGSIDGSGTYIRPTNEYWSNVPQNNYFRAILYLGNILVSNVWLSTQSYFAYNFRLKYNFANNDIKTQSVTNYSIRIIGNNFNTIPDTDPVSPKQKLHNCDAYKNIAPYDELWTPSSKKNDIFFTPI